MLNSSPLRDSSLSGNATNSDNERDLESTEESQDKKDVVMREEGSEKKKKVLNIGNGILIDKFLASDDLNECVDFLLRKEKMQPNPNIK